MLMPNKAKLFIVRIPSETDLFSVQFQCFIPENHVFSYFPVKHPRLTSPQATYIINLSAKNLAHRLRRFRCFSDISSMGFDFLPATNGFSVAMGRIF